MPDPTEPDRDETFADMANKDFDLELFPSGFVEGDQWNLDAISRSHLPINVTVSLSRAEVPTKHGLPDPNAAGRLAVSYEGGKIEIIPEKEEQSDGSKPTMGWKLRCHLRPTYVSELGYGATSARTEFLSLLDDDPNAAAALLDEFKVALTEALQTD